MSLFNIFKKKEEKEPEKIEKKPEKIEKKPVVKKKPVKGEAYSVLAEPHVTEKATELEKENKYVFKVFKTANKIEIKRAVESLYGVVVEDVNIINVPRKKRRIGRSREGWRKGYKKAIVKLAKGHKIEIMPR